MNQPSNSRNPAIGPARGLAQSIPPNWYWVHLNLVHGRPITSPRKNGKNTIIKALQEIIDNQTREAARFSEFRDVAEKAVENPRPAEPVKVEQINHLWKGATMTRKFTDEKLREILTTADRALKDTPSIGIGIYGGGHGIDSTWTESEIDSLRAILDAIPEVEVENWQECGPEDLRQGDRYLLQGKNWRFEGMILFDPTKQEGVLAYHPNSGQLIHAGPETVTLFDQKNTSLYRIPKPVGYPDPEVHQFIRDERDGDIMQATPNGHYIDPHGNFWPATDFTDWKPMKVTEDD